MRRLAPLVALLFAAAALAQGPKGPKAPDDLPGEDAAETKLHRVSLVLDPGWHTKPVRSLAFAPDGRLVSYARDHFVRVTDPASGLSRPLPVPGLPDAKANLLPSDTDQAAVSADGTRVAVPARYPKGDGFERVVYVLSLPDGKVVRTIGGFGPNEWVQAVAVSRDGKKVAVVGTYPKSELRVWTEGADQPAAVPVVGAKRLAFCPGGEHAGRLAVSFGRPKDNGLGVYDVGTGKPVAGPVATTRFPQVLAWSADGTRLAAAENMNPKDDRPTTIGVWTADLKAVRVLDGFDHRVTALGFSPKADRLLAALHPGTHAHRGVVFDLATGKPTAEMRPVAGRLADGTRLGHEAFDSDAGAWGPADAVATGGGRGGAATTLVWDAATAGLTRDLHNRGWLPGEGGGPRAAWSADGRAVAWEGRGATTPAFHLADLKLLPPAPKERFAGPITEAAGVTLDRSVAGKAARVEGGKTGEPFNTGYGMGWTFLRPDSPDRAAIGSRFGARLFDTTTGKPLLTFEGTGGTTSMAPSPDGRYLLVTSLNQTARVFRPDRPAPLLSLYMNGPDWVVWTPEGYYSASPNGDRLTAWKVDNGRDAAPSYFPAETFRARLHRPAVIRLVLETADVAPAVRKADAALPKKAVAAPAAVKNLADVLPPGVTLAVDQSTEPATVTVTATAVAAGQNVKSLRLLLDGRRLRDEDETTAGQAAFVEFADGKEPAEARQVWRVNLPPGRHTLSALARSADDTPSFSPPREVLVTPPPGFRPAVHVVSVGVSQYKTVKPNLRFAHSDAGRVTDAFATLTRAGRAYQAGFIPEPLTDKGATTEKVLAALDAARKEVKPGDLFVFFFAGHGTRDGGEFFLVTHDADDSTPDKLRGTALSGSDLRARLADFRCQVLMILDACHGGQVAGLPPGGDEAARRMAAADARVAVLCAAQGHQKSEEENGAGVFTAALARGLKDPKRERAFYDPYTGELNVAHLHAWVYQEVTRKPDREQTPYLRLPLAHPAATVTVVPVP